MENGSIAVLASGTALVGAMLGAVSAVAALDRVETGQASVREVTPVVATDVTPEDLRDRAEGDFVYEWIDGAYTIKDTVTGVEWIIVAPEDAYTVDWTGSAWILRPTGEPIG